MFRFRGVVTTRIVHVSKTLQTFISFPFCFACCWSLKTALRDESFRLSRVGHPPSTDGSIKCEDRVGVISAGTQAISFPQLVTALELRLEAL